MAGKYDAFTLRRLMKFTDGFRATRATLPTLKDFETAGFESAVVARAVKEGKLVELYVTLTTGAIVKGYKVKV